MTATMKEVLVEDLKEGPKVVIVPIPKPGPKDVLVRINCTPLMSYDMTLGYGGYYGTYKPPFILGIQGSGTVAECGSEAPKELLGKKVMVATWRMKLNDDRWDGTWAQYLVKPADEVFVYDQSISHEIASVMFSNPLTALGIFRKVMNEKPKCVLVIPGASFISKIVTRLLWNEGIKTISVVRKKSTAEIVRKMGMGKEIVVNIGEKDGMENLQKVIDLHQPSVMIDSVSNDVSVKIFAMLPRKSVYIIYGKLSGNQAITLPIFLMMGGEKIIKGHFMTFEDQPDPMGTVWSELKMVQDDILKGGKFFGNTLVRTYTLDNYKDAIVDQSKFASEGFGVMKFE